MIKQQLEGVKKLTEIESQENDIEERLRNVIAEDEGMRTIALEFDKLLKRLRKMNDEETKNSVCHHFVSSYFANRMSSFKIKLMRSAFRIRHEKKQQIRKGLISLSSSRGV